MSKKKTQNAGHSRPREEPQAPKTDVSQIDLTDAKDSEFPEALPSEYRVVISCEAFSSIKEHASSDTSVELCGVLAGFLCKDGLGPYLLVEKAIAGSATRRTGSQVTFTHETWERIHKQMESEPPGLRIIGWYHTHPGFGIFLSDMDQFIQDNFFNVPHNIAFVYDPLADRRGLFAWRDGRSERLRRYWLCGTFCYDLEPEGAPLEQTKEETKSEDSEALRDDSRALWQQKERETSAPPAGVLLLGVLLAVFAAFWIGSKVSRVTSEHSRQQTQVLGNLIRAGLFRDGLAGRLELLERELRRADRTLQRVQSELSRAPAPDEGSDPGSEEGGGAPVQPVAAPALAEAVTAVQKARADLGKIYDEYTEADKLARQMGRVASFSEDISKVRTEIQSQRLFLAALCMMQAERLLTDPSAETAESRRKDAQVLLDSVLRLAPELRDSVRRMLKEHAPGPEQSAQPSPEKAKTQAD